MTERSVSPPPQPAQPPPTPKDESESKIEGVCKFALGILRRFDENSRIVSVVKNDDLHFIKLQLGADSHARTHMASLAALRIAFPFSSVSLVEEVTTGESIFQILAANNLLALQHAKDHFRDKREFRLLRALSNASALTGVAVFASLMFSFIQSYDILQS
jgi:hypothetical protein